MLGPRIELSPHYAELEATTRGLRAIPDTTVGRTVTVWLSNRMVLSTINHPRQQSGQSIIRTIHQEVQRLKVNKNEVIVRWAPADVDLIKRVKVAARSAT